MMRLHSVKLYVYAVDVNKSILNYVFVDPRVLFGRQLRLIRTSAGISQEKLAEHVGCHRTFIGTVERGETNISLVNIVKFARALRVPPAKLLEKN